MDTWYWIMEYGKVLFGYLFFLFLWPSVVFGGHLKGKSKTYCFGFCTTVPIVIASTVVLMLGLFHILHPLIVIALFYGTFFFTLIKEIMRHSFSFHVKEIVKKIRWKIKRACAEHTGEYTVLAVLLIFGVIYFSYGAFQVHSYGFGDLYTHHGWIYGLQEGKIFSGGVYPEAMHCFIYCLNALFGIHVYSSLMFLQGIHVAIFLLAGYLLMREIFHWRYTPLLALTLFLTLDVVCADLIHSMFRLQTTLPMEFGLYAEFLCAVFLLRYLRSRHRAVRKGHTSRYYWDENLFLFFMSLTTAVSIHYYIVAMAFILCACFVIFQLKRVFSKEYFIPLVCSVLCACIIAWIPMAGALALGTPFNDSINWALRIMDGEETRAEKGKDASDGILEKNKPILSTVSDLIEGVYLEGYAELYGMSGGVVILLVTGAGIIVCFLSGKKMPGWMREIFSGYPPLLLFTFLFAFLYAAPLLGLPEPISNTRFGSVGHMMMMALVMIPADIVFSVLIRFFGFAISRAVSFVSVAGIYVLTLATGHFHGYLFFELTRYNAAVEVSNSIAEKFPEKSYVIVAPTDELYPVIENGWHEELLTFVSNIGNKEYTFSSEHTFLFVEKNLFNMLRPIFLKGRHGWLKRSIRIFIWTNIRIS